MKRILFLFLALSLSFSTLAFAHGGRTDEYGGHHDYNNVSGLGSYHYHHGYEAHLHPDGRMASAPMKQKQLLPNRLNQS